MKSLFWGITVDWTTKICVMLGIIFFLIFYYQSNVQKQEIAIKALSEGYIQCVENNFSNTNDAKIVWKKECSKELEQLIKHQIEETLRRKQQCLDKAEELLKLNKDLRLSC